MIPNLQSLEEMHKSLDVQTRLSKSPSLRPDVIVRAAETISVFANNGPQGTKPQRPPNLDKTCTEIFRTSLIPFRKHIRIALSKLSLVKKLSEPSVYAGHSWVPSKDLENNGALKDEVAIIAELAHDVTRYAARVKAMVQAAEALRHCQVQAIWQHFEANIALHLENRLRTMSLSTFLEQEKESIDYLRAVLPWDLESIQNEISCAEMIAEVSTNPITSTNLSVIDEGEREEISESVHAESEDISQKRSAKTSTIKEAASTEAEQSAFQAFWKESQERKTKRRRRAKKSINTTTTTTTISVHNL